MGLAKLNIRLCHIYKSAGVQANLCHFKPTAARSSRPFSASVRSSSTTESLPRVEQPSIWVSLIPWFLRRPASLDKSARAPRSKEWNPATFFIWIWLLIGSQSIQMIGLNNEFFAFSRTADAKIALLKEVIGRVQRGEDVDVEGLLGTGDSKKEREWKDVLREIEQDDALWQSGSQKWKMKKESVVNDAKVDFNNPSEDIKEPQSKSTAAEKISTIKGPPVYH